MESRIIPTPKREGDIIAVSLSDKRASDRLHQLEQKQIAELKRENAWLRQQLRKALATDDREVEIVNGCMVLR